MMRLPSLLALLVVVGPVAGAENLSIGDQASRCWKITPAMKDSEFSAKFDVRMDDAGNVRDIAVVSFAPSTAAGRQAVRSASQAIEQCAPYSIAEGARLRGQNAVGSGKPVLDKPPGLIDPFKPLSLPKE